MKPVRILTHLACEPPGYLAQLLDNISIPFQQVCLYDGETVPRDLDGVSALVIMGGPGNVNQPSDWMIQEMELIRLAVARQTPILGICLGAQLMARALGGDVHQGKSVEVGWHEVELLKAAKTNPCFEKVTEKFPVFQWHAHEFTPPPGATALARSVCTDCQAFVYRNSLAVQFHLEMTESIIRGLMHLYASDLTGDSVCTQNSEQILDDIEARSRQVNRMAELIFTPWFESVYC